jgi:hypothetical protein
MRAHERVRARLGPMCVCVVCARPCLCLACLAAAQTNDPPYPLCASGVAYECACPPANLSACLFVCLSVCRTHNRHRAGWWVGHGARRAALRITDESSAPVMPALRLIVFASKAGACDMLAPTRHEGPVGHEGVYQPHASCALVFCTPCRSFMRRLLLLHKGRPLAPPSLSTVLNSHSM